MQSYIVIYNNKTGQYQLMPIPPGAAFDPIAYLAENGFIENPADYSVYTMEGQRPGETIQADQVASASEWVEQQNARSKNSAVTQQTQEERSRKNKSAVLNAAIDAPPDPMYNPALVANPTDYVAKDATTGAPITDTGWRNARRTANIQATQVVDPTTGQVTTPGTPTDPLDIYGNPRDVQKEAGVGPAYLSPQEMATANRTTLPSSSGAAGTSGTAAGINPATGQPYTMTDRTDLGHLINNGATDADFARYYNKSNNLDGSMQGDFVNRNWEVYDDLWAMQNPGMAMPDSMGQYDNAAQFMQDMGGNGDMVGIINGQQLWDNQFSDPYMQSERARGTGDNFDATAQSQYEQVVTNVLALQPSMGSTNAQMIVGMIDRSYEDYRDLALRNDPTVSGMSFVQYLKSIGAEDWF